MIGASGSATCFLQPRFALLQCRDDGNCVLFRVRGGGVFARLGADGLLARLGARDGHPHRGQREHIGATNTFRALGRTMGVIAMVGDILKGVAAVSSSSGFSLSFQCGVTEEPGRCVPTRLQIARRSSRGNGQE
jgi:hypothetical protein